MRHSDKNMQGRRRSSGQTAALVILFILSFVLAGFILMLNLRQGSEKEELLSKIDKLERNNKASRDSIDDLSSQLRRQRDALDTQKDELSFQNKELAGVKKVIEETAGKVAVIDAAAKQRQDAVQAALASVESKLDGFSAQIIKLKEGTPITAVPVIDVKMDPVTTDIKKAASQGVDVKNKK